MGIAIILLNILLLHLSTHVNNMYLYLYTVDCISAEFLFLYIQQNSWDRELFDFYLSLQNFIYVCLLYEISVLENLYV